MINQNQLSRGSGGWHRPGPGPSAEKKTFSTFFHKKQFGFQKGRKPLPAQGVSPYSTGVRPASQDNGLFLRVAVCVNTDRDNYRAPCVCICRVLVFGVLGMGRVVAIPAGFGARPPLVRSPLSLSLRPFTLPSEIPLAVFECLYEFLVHLEAAVRLHADQLVLSVPAWDAFCPQPPALSTVPSFFTLPREPSFWTASS